MSSLEENDEEDGAGGFDFGQAMPTTQLYTGDAEARLAVPLDWDGF